MNSTAKGDRFEAKIFTLLKREVSNGQFFVRPECCRFFRKKGYYSDRRKENIYFDISIEIYLPGHDAYSLLILVECKDYGKRVPVDDAEEFLAKVEQVSGANVKGIIVSTNAFSRGAFEYCKSTGIGLLRYYDKSTLKWELERSPSSITHSTPDWVDIHTGLVSDSHRSRHFDLYCHSGSTHTYSLYAFLRNLAHDSTEAQSTLVPIEMLSHTQPPLVPHVAPQQVEAMSEAVLKKICYSGAAVSLDAICQWQSKETGLIVATGVAPVGSDLTNGTLGRIRFDPLEITILNCAERYRGQRRFTLAHELAHHLLGHSKYMMGEECEEKDFGRDGPPNLGIEDVYRMEWQANHFASCLLLPKESFVSDFFALVREYDLKDHGYGVLFVDEQPCNQHAFYVITDSLRLKYDVSRSAVEIRLKKFGLLKDTRAHAK
jgi:Zn-dependent peptidase ImmA (M78 family)